jgi:endonuclease YncB( thermonuclease family)
MRKSLFCLFALSYFFLSSIPLLAAENAPVTLQVSVVTYDELLVAIRQTKAESRLRLEQAVEQEKVREAWEIGKLINAHVLQHKERANYGERVIEKLAKDLRTSSTELRLMLQFARTYPIHPAPDELSWAHYRELLSINDETQRRNIAARAVKEKWGHKRTREEVRHVQRRAVAPVSLGEVQPGKLYTYRIVKAQAGPLKGERVLDLGFATYFRPEGVQNFKEGDTVIFEKGKLRKVEATEQDLWTYRAYVTQVMDGDTFEAIIDLGFEITMLQKLRLRGLDAREIESREGMEAKKFLEKQLQTSPILIRTVKSDKYDRYLADVFAQGKYINQELVEEGLAVLVQE